MSHEIDCSQNYFMHSLGAGFIVGIGVGIATDMSYGRSGAFILLGALLGLMIGIVIGASLHEKKEAYCTPKKRKNSSVRVRGKSVKKN